MSTSGWCISGKHDQCPREFTRFYIDQRTKRAVETDEIHYCACKKRTCPCYKANKERNK